MKREWLVSLLLVLASVAGNATSQTAETSQASEPADDASRGTDANPASAPAPSGSLTLDSAISEGLRQSPEIQRAKAAVGEKSWGSFEALASGFLPRFSITATHYFDTQYTVTGINFGGGNLVFPGFFPQTSASLDVSMPLFDGLSNIRRLQSANLMKDAAQEDLDQAEFQLSQEIRVAFFQALAASELREVAQENVKTLEDHLRQVTIQHRGGVATNYDTLRVEVQLSEAKADAIDTEDNVTLTRKKLAQLMGLKQDDRGLSGDLPVPDAERVKSLELAPVPKDRHDIQSLNLRAEAADRNDSARAVWMIPTVSLFGQYMLYNQQFFNTTVTDTGNYQNAYNVGIQLKWNLFDGGVSLAQGQQASYHSQQEDKKAELAKLQIPYDFAYWKRRYLSNSDHYLSKKFDITRSQESVRLAKAEERAGSRTSTETLDAELDLFRARAGVVNAQVNAAEALIRLEMALGRRI